MSLVLALPGHRPSTRSPPPSKYTRFLLRRIVGPRPEVCSLGPGDRLKDLGLSLIFLGPYRQAAELLLESVHPGSTVEEIVSPPPMITSRRVMSASMWPSRTVMDRRRGIVYRGTLRSASGALRRGLEQFDVEVVIAV